MAAGLVAAGDAQRRLDSAVAPTAPEGPAAVLPGGQPGRRDVIEAIAEITPPRRQLRVQLCLGTSPDEVRAYLKEILPAYMQPTIVTGIDRLPLTANGKVDRAALAAKASPPVSPNSAAIDGAQPSVLHTDIARLLATLLDRLDINGAIEQLKTAGELGKNAEVVVVIVEKKPKARKFLFG